MSTLKNRGKIFDALLEMHGIGVVVGSTVSTPVDLGGSTYAIALAGTGGQRDSQIYTEGKLILDVSRVGAETQESRYEIRLQGSHDATFTTWDTLFVLPLGSVGTIVQSAWMNNPVGAAAVARMYSSTASWPTASHVPVRVTLPFCNDFGGTVYRWLRLFTACGGTDGTAINYYGFLSI